MDLPRSGKILASATYTGRKWVLATASIPCPDPEDSRRGYVMSQGGNLSTWNLDTGEQRSIRPAPQAPGIELRFNWNAAIAQDPFDPATIYYGSQFVHKSTDRGATWTVISGDMTSNNPEWQTFRESGGLTSDVTAGRKLHDHRIHRTQPA